MKNRRFPESGGRLFLTSKKTGKAYPSFCFSCPSKCPQVALAYGTVNTIPMKQKITPTEAMIAARILNSQRIKMSFVEDVKIFHTAEKLKALEIS